MSTTLKTAVVTVGLIFGCVAAAVAADFCIDNNNGNTVVLKAFSLPGKGACKEARGFFASGPFWTSGSACGSSDGTNVTIALNTANHVGTQILTDFIVLNRSTQTGTFTECAVGSGGVGCSVSIAAKITCSPSKVPVP